MMLSSRLLMLTRQWTKLLLHMMMKSKIYCSGYWWNGSIAVQGNGTEASHGTTMEDISMDERAAVVEGTETRQGELAIEDGSVGNGTVDADGAQARGVKGVSEVQDAQVVGGNGLMVSGSILRQNEMKIGGTLGSYRHSGLQKLLEPLE